MEVGKASVPDEVIAHHPHILVFEVVAVVEEDPGVPIEIGQDPDAFPGHQ